MKLGSGTSSLGRSMDVNYFHEGEQATTMSNSLGPSRNPTSRRAVTPYGGGRKW
jgi:hypothetical protein